MREKKDPEFPAAFAGQARLAPGSSPLTEGSNLSAGSVTSLEPPNISLSIPGAVAAHGPVSSKLRTSEAGSWALRCLHLALSLITRGPHQDEDVRASRTART